MTKDWRPDFEQELGETQIKLGLLWCWRQYRHLWYDPENEPLLLGIAVEMLFISFSIGAVVKLSRLPIEVAFFHDCQLPLWLMSLVGLIEGVIAVLLVYRNTTTIAAFMGIGMMIGALSAVVVAQWWILLPLPPVHALLLWWVGWTRRLELARWGSSDFRNSDDGR